MKKQNFLKYFRTFITDTAPTPHRKTLNMKKKDTQTEHRKDLLSELVAKTNPDREKRRREQRKMIVYASIMNPKFDDELL